MKIQRIPLTIVGGYDAKGQYISVRTAPIGDDMMYIIVMRDAEIVLQSLVAPTDDDDAIASLIAQRRKEGSYQ